MRNKKLIFMSLTLCLTIGLSACGKRPVDNTVKENTATATAPEVKEEPKKEEVKAETPKEEPKKEEVKKEVAPVTEKKTATVTTNNTSKSAEQPKQTTQQSLVAPTTPTTPNINVYAERHIDENSLIRNSSDFKVTLSNTSPKIGENITVKIESNESKNLSTSTVEVYGENMKSGANAQWSSDKKTYTDTIVIQNWKLQDGNKIDSYIFITDNDTKKQYEYRFTLNVQQ